MDLNKAMVNLYKQKSLPLKKTNINGKLDTSNAQDSRDKKWSSPIEEITRNKPQITFDDLHGIEYVKDEILCIVDHFKRALEGRAIKSNRPMLICGSSGLGKTSLVEAAAHYANLKMISIPLVMMTKQTRNEFKESLEHLLRHSISNQPAIVLIDDLEQVADKEEYKNLVVAAIPRLLDEQHKLLIFCTTSSLDVVTDIRFLFTIQLKRPTLEARLKILKSLRVRDENLSNLTDDCIQTLASNTPSFSVLDLQDMLAIAVHKSGGMTSLDHCDKAIDIVKKSFKRGTHFIGEKPSVTWDDIGGMSDVRQEFTDILRQTKRGARSCKFAGIALYGPPGCGKTMVAQAMANEGGFNFISIQAAELVNKFLGETERNIRRVFQEAQEHEPCMIYFDEFDGLCGSRGNKDNITSAIQTLLSEMDGFSSRGQTMILVSTNRLEDIDQAMLRPGRLTYHFYVGPPDEQARRDILGITTSKPWISLASDVNLDYWAKETNNFSGSDLHFLVQKAESRAVRDLDNQSLQVTLKQEHFDDAMKAIRLKNREVDKKTRVLKRRKLR